MALPKGCYWIVIAFIAILIVIIIPVIIVFASKNEKRSEWCDILNAGDCARLEPDQDCYCIAGDSKQTDFDNGIYADAKSKCEILSGSLAVPDNEDVLRWLSRRLYEQGIDNALIGLQKINGVWHWMHSSGPTPATKIQWRKEFPVYPNHTCATLNVETIKTKINQTDARDNHYEDDVIYYNYHHFLDNDPQYQWYGFKSSDNFLKPNQVYYICSYSKEPTSLVTEPDLSQDEQGVQECDCEEVQEIRLSAMGESQTFTSPRFPNNYCSDLNCRWLISAPEHLAIEFKTLAFNIENTFDYIHIYDGDNLFVGLEQDARRVGFVISRTMFDDTYITVRTFRCTGSVCSTLKSKTNHMQVDFIADLVATDLGFKIRVTVIESVDTVVENYCDKIHVPMGSVTYSDETTDGKIPVNATATLQCPENTKIAGTSSDTTDKIWCDGSKWNDHLKLCTTVCQIDKVQLTKDSSLEMICSLEQHTDGGNIENGHSVKVEYYSMTTGLEESMKTLTCYDTQWHPVSPQCHSPMRGILVIGGIHGAVHPDIELYNPSTNLWLESDDAGFELHQARYKHVSAVLDNGILVVCGGVEKDSDGQDSWIRSCELIDLYSKQVISHPEMKTARQTPGIAIFNSEVVICGGIAATYDATGAISAPRSESSCEVLRQGNWVTMEEQMQQSREAPVMVSIDDMMLVIGGHYSVEKYSLTVPRWEYVAPLLSDLLSPAACVYGRTVVVCGGEHNYVSMMLCYQYFVDEERWEYDQFKRVPNMNQARQHFALATFGGKIYALGGIERTHSGIGDGLDAIERYEPENNRWVFEERRLKETRYYHTALALPAIKH